MIHVLRKIKYKLIQYFKAYILKDDRALLAMKWLKEDRKLNFRYRYEISQSGIIFDLGGYKGEWTSKMSALYPNAKILVFELVPKYVDILEQKFSSTPNIEVENFGLGNGNKEVSLIEDGVASGVYHDNNAEQKIVGHIKDVVEFMEERSINKVDLLKMNIEGGEYELLEKIIESKILDRFENIQIQFHNYGESFVKRREQIRQDLSETHHLTYDYPWIFENWEKINKNA